MTSGYMGRYTGFCKRSSQETMPQNLQMCLGSLKLEWRFDGTIDIPIFKYHTIF